MRIPLLAAFCLSCLAAPAMADGPMATSNPSQPPAPIQMGAPPPLVRNDAFDASDDAQAVIGSCGPTQATADGQPSTAPHGEIEVGVGTNGFRHLSAAVCKPLGDTGSLSIGFGTAQFGSAPSRR